MGQPLSRFGSRPIVSSRVALALSLLCVGAALLACGATAASAVTLTHGTASVLTLSIRIEPLYPELTSGKAEIHVGIADAASHPVNLRNGQKLTCNGMEFPHGGQPLFGSSTVPDSLDIQVSSPPPGGAYTFVYTDEHGTRSKYVVPVGSTPLQVLSPRAGDVLSIPTPTASLIGTPATTAVPSPQSRDLGASLVVQYQIPETPPGATIKANIEAFWAIPDCVPPEKRFGYTSCSSRYELGFVNAVTADSSDTGAALVKTVTISDGPPYEGYPFASFQPGPGWIDLDATIDWTAATTEFAAVHIEMRIATEIPVTWVR